jgi:hypothetical protein
MKNTKFKAVLHILTMYASQGATYWDLAKESKRLWTDDNYLMAEAITYGA